MFGQNDRISPQKRAMLKKSAGKFLDTRWAEGVSELLAGKEDDLLGRVAQLAEASDLADPSGLDLDRDAGERADEIRAGVEAIIGGEFPEWFVSTYDLGKRPDRLAKLADSNPEDIQRRMNGWVSAYRDAEDVADKSDPEIVRMHLGRSFGVDLRTFAEITHWSDRQHEQAVRQLLVGRLDRAEELVEEMTAAARDGGPDA